MCHEILLDTEESCDIGFKLIVNKELVARILEYGDDVEVIGVATDAFAAIMTQPF